MRKKRPPPHIRFQEWEKAYAKPKTIYIGEGVSIVVEPDENLLYAAWWAGRRDARPPRAKKKEP